MTTSDTTALNLRFERPDRSVVSLDVVAPMLHAAAWSARAYDGDVLDVVAPMLHAAAWSAR